jgi:hypothetical protein
MVRFSISGLSNEKGRDIGHGLLKGNKKAAGTLEEVPAASILFACMRFSGGQTPSYGCFATTRIPCR